LRIKKTPPGLRKEGPQRKKKHGRSKKNEQLQKRDIEPEKAKTKRTAWAFEKSYQRPSREKIQNGGETVDGQRTDGLGRDNPHEKKWRGQEANLPEGEKTANKPHMGGKSNL